MSSLTDRKVLKDKKIPRRQRRFTYEWLSEQPNFVLVYAALETAQRIYLGAAHHPGMGGGTAPCRHHAKKLSRRYARIMANLAAMLKA